MATSSGIRNLASIPTLTQLYRTGALLASAEQGLPTPSADLNNRVSVIKGDITKLEIDAIVNAANQGLSKGAGVDHAIHMAAGVKEMMAACEALNKCAIGSAKMTDGFKLPCKKVMHAVGPIYNHHTKSEAEKLLRGAYRTSLQLAVDNNCKSIAFPAISTGVYGYPAPSAAMTALSVVKEFLEGNDGQKLERVVFVNFMDRDMNIYYNWLPEIFPVTPDIIAGYKGMLHDLKSSLKKMGSKEMSTRSSFRSSRARTMSSKWIDMKLVRDAISQSNTKTIKGNAEKKKDKVVKKNAGQKQKMR